MLFEESDGVGNVAPRVILPPMDSPMLKLLADLPLKRMPWLLLFLTAIGLEATALVFQHVMKLDPCVLCIYERVAVIGIMFAGLLGAVAPGSLLMRWGGFLLWLVSAVWGVKLTLKHVGIQFGSGLDLSCTYFAEFPSWAPLDQWWPAVFMPTGMCGDIQWVFLGLSMPQWMLVIFCLYLAAWVVVVGSHLLRHRLA